MRASYAEYERLETAYEAFLLSEANARFLNCSAGTDQEIKRWNELLIAAMACGYSLRSDEACIEFARRWVRSFRNVFGRRAA